MNYILEGLCQDIADNGRLSNKQKDERMSLIMESPVIKSITERLCDIEHSVKKMHDAILQHDGEIGSVIGDVADMKQTLLELTDAIGVDRENE